jgi:phosphoglycolate phosphatase
LAKFDGRNVMLVDLDGALTDPAPGIVGSCRYALEAMGCVPPQASDLRWIIGPPLRESFKELLGRGRDPEEALRHYRSRYSVEGLFEATVYDGVPDALTDLRGAGLALFLCTSKPKVYAERILRHFNLDRWFDGVYGAELDGRFDDKGDLIAHLLDAEGLRASDVCMLGDRKHDVLAARRHGAPTIGALWGYGGEAELRAAGAAALCASPKDILSTFNALGALAWSAGRPR